MNVIKTKPVYFILSLVCGIGIFPMSMLFQIMAYWGNSLTWYWVGVVLTYALFGIGVTSLIFANTKKNESHHLLLISLSIVLSLLLLMGFLWTTFIVITGMSGM